MRCYAIEWMDLKLDIEQRRIFIEKIFEITIKEIGDGDLFCSVLSRARASQDVSKQGLARFSRVCMCFAKLICVLYIKRHARALHLYLYGEQKERRFTPPPLRRH